MATASKKVTEEYTLVLSREQFIAVKSLIAAQNYSVSFHFIWKAMDEVPL